MNYTILDALTTLCPKGQWTCTGFNYSDINWLDDTITIPTESELNTEVTRLQTQWTADEYKRSRSREYPDMGTQLDYIYHNGLDKWKTDIVDPVKAKYPKPS